MDHDDDCACVDCMDDRDARFLVEDLGIDAGFIVYARNAARQGMSVRAALLASELAEEAQEDRQERRDLAAYNHAHRAGAL